MRLTINHKTSFHYESPPAYGLLQLRKTPRSSPLQSILSWTVTLSGARKQADFLDQHGNCVDLIEVEADTSKLEIEVSGDVDTRSDDGVLPVQPDTMPLWMYKRQTALTAPDDALRAVADTITCSPDKIISELHQLSHQIREHVAYQPGETGVATTATDAWRAQKGVCQDHSHIFLSLARLKGLPARYVSGYLLMDDRTIQEASHAWTEVYVQDLGWVGFDISNGISPDQRYVRIAHGSDYADAAPTRGLTLGAGRENLIVSIQVQQ